MISPVHARFPTCEPDAEKLIQWKSATSKPFHVGYRVSPVDKEQSRLDYPEKEVEDSRRTTLTREVSKSV